MKFKLLFCLASGAIGGANRILLELSHRAEALGHHCEVFLWNSIAKPRWFTKKLTFSQELDIRDAVAKDFDFIFFSNAYLMPLALDSIKMAKPVLVCQGYEEFCHGSTFEELFAPKESVRKLHQLPIEVMAISRSVQTILKDRAGVESFYVPPSIDETLFEPKSRQSAERSCSVKTSSSTDRTSSSTGNASVRRVLAVGDYLQPLKGISDLCTALDRLHLEMPVQLVMITQQKRERFFFERFSFPVEIHVTPEQAELYDIYASCDLYCCASWYEGFGLPCLEAFKVGIPVVCTDNYGVSDFGLDGINMLIATANSPSSLYSRLRQVLTDKDLSDSLVSNGRKTLPRYNWQETMSCFDDCLTVLAAKPRDGLDFETRETAVGSLSPQSNSEMLQELRAHGYFTDLDQHQALPTLSLQLEQVCRQMATRELSIESGLERLIEIRDQLRRHTSNSKSNAFAEFKGRYDLCNLLISASSDKRFDRILQMATAGLVAPLANSRLNQEKIDRADIF